MRIPPLMRLATWQRFFVGVAFGAVISWIVFLFIFGELQEKQTKLISQQQNEITELNSNIKIWQEEFKALNKKNEQKLTVQDIKIKIVNSDKYKLDSFSVFEVEKQVKEDVTVLNAKDVESVYKSKDIFKKMIENKTIKINEKRYKLRVTEITIFTTLAIEIELQLQS